MKGTALLRLYTNVHNQYVNCNDSGEMHIPLDTQKYFFLQMF